MRSDPFPNNPVDKAVGNFLRSFVGPPPDLNPPLPHRALAVPYPDEFPPGDLRGKPGPYHANCAGTARHESVVRASGVQRAGYR